MGAPLPLNLSCGIGLAPRRVAPDAAERRSRIPSIMHRLTAAALAFAASFATTIRAQDVPPTDSTKSSSIILGGTIMIPQVSGMSAAEFTAVGLTVTPARPNRLGADLAFVIVPRALGYGVVGGAVRANIGLPIRAGPNMLFVPSVGVSLVGAVGAIGGFGTQGVNATLALLYRFDPPRAGESSIGLRTALGFHRFGSSADGGVRMFEIGIVRWMR